MSIPYLQMQTASDFGKSVAGGLTQGINNFFGQIPFFNNNNANANYYKAAQSLMPGYDPSNPTNIPKGIGSMSNEQVNNLIKLTGQTAQNQQNLNTMNALLTRINPNAQPYQSGLSPDIVQKEYEAETTPILKAKGEQAANEITGGPLYNALLPTLQTNPETIFGADSPIPALLKSNPSILTNSKSLSDLETALEPVQKAHEASIKAQYAALQGKNVESEIAEREARGKIAQGEYAMKQALQPLEMQKYKAEIDNYGKGDKSATGKLIDDINESDALTPEVKRAAINHIIQNATVSKSNPLDLELQKEKGRQDLQRAKQIEQLRVAASQAKDPHQRAQLLEQAAQLSGQAPGLKYPVKRDAQGHIL